MSNEVLIVSDDDDDEVETIRVVWNKTFSDHYFELKKTEKFIKIFQGISTLYSVPVDEIQILHNGKEIFPEDTYQLRGIQVFDDIIALKAEKGDALKELGEPGDGKVIVKLQSNNRKKPLVVHLRQAQSFNAVYELCSKEFNWPIGKIKLMFDGDVIKGSDSPASVDIDDEACMDVVMH